MTVATYRILTGDALEQLRTLPDASVQCCITSPPYFGLRDYGTARWDGGDPSCDHGVRRWEGPKQTQGAQSGHPALGDRLDRSVCHCGATRVDQQIGMESTPDEYVDRLVEVFREVGRVLVPTGTCWIVLGDSYVSAPNGRIGATTLTGSRRSQEAYRRAKTSHDCVLSPGLKTKDLIGIPWRVAFALQADGWWLRSEIIWDKSANAMPESVKDRPTRSHETIFLLAKSERYSYDAGAIKEPGHVHLYDRRYRPGAPGRDRGAETWNQTGPYKPHRGFAVLDTSGGRNRRDVWRINPTPFRGAHFATFPESLVEPMVLAGCPEGGTVLDPFAGSGTTLAVANRLGRHALGIELNPAYVDLVHQRVQQAAWVLGEEALEGTTGGMTDVP